MKHTVSPRGWLKDSGKSAKKLYSDKPVEIYDDFVLIRNYYWPFGNKQVRFQDIESVLVVEPTLKTGKYRYYGSGDFRTWFPPDNRSRRDRIFVITIRGRWWRVGLTVEDSQAVLEIFKRKCLVIDQTAECSREGAD